MFETSKALYVQFRSESSFDKALFVNSFVIAYVQNCSTSSSSTKEFTISSQADLNDFFSGKGGRGASKVLSIDEESISFSPITEEQNIFITKMDFSAQADHVSLRRIHIVDGC